MRAILAVGTPASILLLICPLIISSTTFAQTTLELSPDPGGSTACKAITLQATLKPSSAGTVQFFESVDKNISNLGKPQKIDGSGNATLTISLPMGAHNLGALFQPDGSSKPSLTAKEQSFAVGPATGCDQPVDIVQIITGVAVSAASSANPTAVFVAASVLDVPVASKNVRIKNVHNWISGDLRISGIAQPGAIGGNTSVANYFSTATNTTPDRIVQSAEVQGSIRPSVLRLEPLHNCSRRRNCSQRRSQTGSVHLVLYCRWWRNHSALGKPGAVRRLQHYSAYL
jgi:hypothetical protein